MNNSKNSYNDSIIELEAIIESIEGGELSVDELTKMVKKAADLVKKCKDQLRTTEEELNKTLKDLD
jgi:exodeoxyribonuclease VII small subunit